MTPTHHVITPRLSSSDTSTRHARRDRSDRPQQESGATIIEYVLMAVLVSIAAIAALTGTRDSISSKYNLVSDKTQEAL